MNRLDTLAIVFPTFSHRQGPASLPEAGTLGVLLIIGVLGLSLGAALIYGITQILRGGRAQLCQRGSRMTLRESNLATRCRYIFLGVFLPSLSAMMLVLGVYADATALMIGAGLGLLITGAGALFFFLFLFDRATHIDRDRHRVRRGRRERGLQDFHGVGVETASHSFRGRSYPFFAVSLLSAATDAAGADGPRAVLDPFQRIFSSKHEAVARAAAESIASFTGLTLR